MPHHFPHTATNNTLLPAFSGRAWQPSSSLSNACCAAVYAPGSARVVSMHVQMCVGGHLQCRRVKPSMMCVDPATALPRAIDSGGREGGRNVRYEASIFDAPAPELCEHTLRSVVSGGSLKLSRATCEAMLALYSCGRMGTRVQYDDTGCIKLLQDCTHIRIVD